MQRQRDEIADLLAKLETAAGDVKGANAALGKEVEAIALDARQGRAAVEGTTEGASGS